MTPSDESNHSLNRFRGVVAGRTASEQAQFPGNWGIWRAKLRPLVVQVGGAIRMPEATGNGGQGKDAFYQLLINFLIKRRGSERTDGSKNLKVPTKYGREGGLSC